MYQHTINVGKTGLTESVLTEIKTRIEKHGQIRIKFLPSAENRKELVAALAGMVDAKKVSKIGFVVVLAKK